MSSVLGMAQFVRIDDTITHPCGMDVHGPIEDLNTVPLRMTTSAYLELRAWARINNYQPDQIMAESEFWTIYDAWIEDEVSRIDWQKLASAILEALTALDHDEPISIEDLAQLSRMKKTGQPLF